MKERPILFSAPMVKAILDGRKTVTRRVVRWPEWLPEDSRLDAAHAFSTGLPRAGLFKDGRPTKSFGCPFGEHGDRLWVREAWGYRGGRWSGARPNERSYDLEYRADGAQRSLTMPLGWDERGLPRPRQPEGQSTEDYYADTLTRFWRSWRPSIHMPRWASRITLEVTGVRVERLQSISTMEAMAEGVDPRPVATGAPSYTHGFRVLWDAINAKRAPWSSNPWVWVVEFKRLESAAEAA